jgi:pilus assembly protein CpaE
MQMPIVVSAIVRSPDIQAIAEVATRDLNLRISVASGFTAATLKTLEGDVLLIDMDIHSPGEMRALHEFIGTENKPVIVTAPHLDVANMRELFRLGVSDVLAQPLVQQELVAALENAAARFRVKRIDRRQPGQVVSFLKSSGGVGATTLAVQSACALGHGKDGQSVALIDFDLQFGGTACQIGAESHVSVLDLVHTPERIDATLMRSAMVRAHNRFDLLGAPKDVPGLEGVDGQAVAALLKVARSEFALTMLDMPLMWRGWVSEALSRSDAIILVTNLTVPSLRQARRQMDTLVREGLDKVALKIVINRVKDGFFSKSTIGIKDAEIALGRKPDYTIAEDQVFSLAGNLGVPLSEVTGGASVAKKLARMMDKLIEKQPEKV